MFSLLLNRIIELKIISSTKFKSSLIFTLVSNIYVLFLPSLILEVISLGFRSFSLGFRMIANFAAGHVLGDLLFTMNFSFFNYLITLASNTIISLCHLIYESIVAFIQVLIFSTLIGVYLETS